MKQGFGGLFERKWRNHLLCFKKISNRMLHKSVSFHLRFNILLVPGFAMSSVRFIVPRKPCQCRTALPIIWSVSNICFVTGKSRFGLELLSLPWSHTMFAPAVVCSRALLVPTRYWILMLLVGKERPWSSRKGKSWGFSILKDISAPEALCPGERCIQTEAFTYTVTFEMLLNQLILLIVLFVNLTVVPDNVCRPAQGRSSISGFHQWWSFMNLTTFYLMV